MNDKPISEEYRLAAKDMVALEAAANLLEESKTATLARLVSDQGDIPVNRAETNVKASKQWQEYLKSMVQARHDASLAKVKVKWIEMRFNERQSSEATARSERRL